ncbi:MAG: metallophosphoesterase [Pirellulales bacterium]|nr:metallophosphoesterase [Pirellulales bacterium]
MARRRRGIDPWLPWILIACSAPTGRAHEGPDPISHWFFAKSTVRNGEVEARLGPNAKVMGDPKLVEDRLGSALRFDGVQDRLLIAPTYADARDYLPARFITVAAWVVVEAGKPQGAIVSTFEKDGPAERGWLLGYDDKVFRFAVSTVDASDGDGRAAILKGKTEFEPGKYYHVVGVYDGAEMRLYVNGQLEAASDEQHGPIYPSRYAGYVIGAFADHDDLSCHQGLIRDVAVYDLAATEKWVKHDFDHGSDLLELDKVDVADELTFVVPPYLQFVTTDGITVMCETSRPAKVTVRYGAFGEEPVALAAEKDDQIHEIRLKDLKAQTPHHYQVEATDDRGRTSRSPLLTLQTANHADTPFAFGILSDTQENPHVCKVLSDMLWMQRPNFVIIPGDLVDSGPNKRQWVEEFFPGMQPLASRVAFFPVLGNHEQNTAHYYNYMSLPEPEYYYAFRYGNAQFFMLDSNKRVDPDSEQYKWLESQLTESTATWKFVSYHHPAYSSDEDDYGDMWKGESSTHGDLRLRPLVTLYDRYGVDIVWNGHIHSYERTWPLKADKPAEAGGTIYMVTGGAGGRLETAGPVKPWFQNNVKHGHHYCLVSVNGRRLEFKAFDLEGRAFDFMTIDKQSPSEPLDRRQAASEQP